MYYSICTSDLTTTTVVVDAVIGGPRCNRAIYPFHRCQPIPSSSPSTVSTPPPDAVSSIYGTLPRSPTATTLHYTNRSTTYHQSHATTTHLGRLPATSTKATAALAAIAKATERPLSHADRRRHNRGARDDGRDRKMSDGRTASNLLATPMAPGSVTSVHVPKPSTGANSAQPVTSATPVWPPEATRIHTYPAILRHSGYA